MNRARPSGGDRARITVGVYDEPQLIVSGIASLLTSEGHRAHVHAIDPDEPTPADLGVDVLLCDPVGRQVPIEDYVSSVIAMSGVPVLVFTWSASAASQRRSLAAGARGFLSKSSGAAALAAAVDALGRGETAVPERARTLMPNGMTELSARETEVLELICQGHSNMEIAEDLFISVNSVKTYVRQIYQKIGVARRAQAVAWGLAQGY